MTPVLGLCLCALASSETADEAGKPELRGRVVTGYQGWFLAEGDGHDLGFNHWGAKDRFEPGFVTVDYWPDMTEAGPTERYPTVFRHADGSPAEVFSSAHPDTVKRHFQWMADYGIGGAMLQRFAAPLKDARFRAFRDKVLANVRDASRSTGTPWAMMYDLSGLREGEVASVMLEDLRGLIASDDFRDDPHYLHHNGKPLLAVWGVGFSDKRRYSLDETIEMVRVLKEDAQIGGWAIMLGVPYWWRTTQRDAVADPRFLELMADIDVVSPWTVGRVRSLSDIDERAEVVLRPDSQWLADKGVSYLPVIYPGFSWANYRKSVYNEEAAFDAVPRLDGQFLWQQAVRAMDAGRAEMLYVAMFDEVDEGTAIFKVASEPPVGETRFLTYGSNPPDHYLWLTGQIQRALRGEIPASLQMPTRDDADAPAP